MLRAFARFPAFNPSWTMFSHVHKYMPCSGWCGVSKFRFMDSFREKSGPEISWNVLFLHSVMSLQKCTSCDPGALILVCPNSSVMSRGIRFESLGNIHLMQDPWNKCVLTQMTSRGYPLHRHRFARGCSRICAVTVMHPISSSSWPLPWAWMSV